MFSGGLVLLIRFVLWLRKCGPLRDFVNEEHLHDLGKLLFAFCTFWMYIWFSQFVLVCYAEISDETAYCVARLRNDRAPLFLLNMILNWAVPFAALLPRGTKRSPRALGRVAAGVLAGRVLDVYLLIASSLVGSRPAFGIGVMGALAGRPESGACLLPRNPRGCSGAPERPVPGGKPARPQCVNRNRPVIISAKTTGNRGAPGHSRRCTPASQ
jgi:hypothetical protein